MICRSCIRSENFAFLKSALIFKFVDFNSFTTSRVKMSMKK